MTKQLITFYLSLVMGFAHAQTLEFHSGIEQTNVIEVFTSEGCSSCPPADAWLSSFKSHPELFSKVIPLTFHVDYWDWLGWQDRFASPLFSQRQRDYVKQRNLSQAYTPGILVNSQEWRAWFKGQRNWPNSTQTPGVLSLLIEQNNASLSFNSAQDLQGHFAVLGMGIESQVKNGENRGKRLTHDFVVLHYQQQSLLKGSEFVIPHRSTFLNAKQLALVAWVSEQKQASILQAVGGYWLQQ